MNHRAGNYIKHHCNAHKTYTLACGCCIFWQLMKNCQHLGLKKQGNNV